jgi:drug/metabolite transporter (DMT)-like permease
MLKKLKPTMPAISITVGSLIVATPLFILNWLLFGAGLPTTIPDRTLYSILYLAIAGTGIGFPLYYYVLKHLSAGHVSLVTLITPVTALLMGAAFNHEAISSRVWVGTGLIMLGLFVHELKKFSRMWAR